MAFANPCNLQYIEPVNKKLLFESLKTEIKNNLQLAYAAAQNTYDIATHEDSKAENKYDTRGLEASYLAGAQAERVMDLKDTLTLVASIAVKEFSVSDKIGLTALLHLKAGEKKLWVLLLPKGGGQSFTFEEKLIQVITPESPLGEQLVGKQVDDSFTINKKEYEIAEIF